MQTQNLHITFPLVLLQAKAVSLLPFIIELEGFGGRCVSISSPSGEGGEYDCYCLDRFYVYGFH